jgi:hypothetical protein
MKENNFNLLYLRLGWYGCHYLLPEDRILKISGYKLKEEEDKIFETLHYSRCLFGKGVILKNLKENKEKNFLIDMVKDSIRSLDYTV